MAARNPPGRNPPGRNPPGTGMLRLLAATLFIGAPILALIFRSWSLGALVFGLGAIVLGIRQIRLGGAPQRTLPRGSTLAWRRVHRDRRLGTPPVRSITLRGQKCASVGGPLPIRPTA